MNKVGTAGLGAQEPSMSKWLKTLWARISALFQRKKKPKETDVPTYGMEVRNSQGVEVSATSNNHFIVDKFTPDANGSRTYPMYGNDVIEAYIDETGEGSSYSYYIPTSVTVSGGVVSWSGITGALYQGTLVVIRRGVA